MGRIDYVTFLQLNLSSPRPTRLIVELAIVSRRRQQALAIMQHLAANMSDSVTDLEVHGLKCDQASHAAMREAFGRFTSVTSLFLSSESSPSFVISLVTAFQSLTSLKLDSSPHARQDWREGIDQFSGSKLSFLPSTLTDVELFFWTCDFIGEAKCVIFLESILAGLSENAGLKRLALIDLFDFGSFKMI